MQYNADTAEAYMDQLEDDWRREKLEHVRALIKDAAPHLKEGIEFKMLRYADEKGSVFHLNAQKNYVGLYVGDIKKIDPNDELLKGIDKGKGCVRIKKTNTISDTNIGAFIERTITLRAQGIDIEC